MLFCDSSALVKLYFDEEGSEVVQRMAAQADFVGACRVAWAEVHASFARKSRENPAILKTLEAGKAAFQANWQSWIIVDVTQRLVEEAGAFAETFALRGYDSVQLAAARSASEDASVFEFATFDVHLSRAARVLGMRVPLLAP
jgi:uncharacterized protein